MGWNPNQETLWLRSSFREIKTRAHSRPCSTWLRRAGVDPRGHGFDPQFHLLSRWGAASNRSIIASMWPGAASKTHLTFPACPLLRARSPGRISEDINLRRVFMRRLPTSKQSQSGDTLSKKKEVLFPNIACGVYLQLEDVFMASLMDCQPSPCLSPFRALEG